MPMESEKKTQPTKNAELLMAALEGDWTRVRNLLGNDDATAAAAQPVASSEPGVVVVVEEAPPAETINIDVTFGPELDTILHVVASSGEGYKFLESAMEIYGNAKNLLGAINDKGDTPLHCAARTGRIKMVSCLIALAKGDVDGDGDAKVKALLRMQNKQGATALHEALLLANKQTRNAMVEVLLSADPKLARFLLFNGTSTLYLAVSLGHDDIAILLHSKDKELSYSGPDGQNVLHVAVLRSKEMTEKLLKWNKDLIKQGDSTGNTPLHIAVSWASATWPWGNKNSKVIKLLLETDESSALFQRDKSGSFPIHVAAMTMWCSVLHLLITRKPSCIELRDANGKTFLHIAVEKERSFVVGYACWNSKMFAPILNMQDNEGNTALHLAAEVGNQWSFYNLIQNKRVQLNLLNKNGHTPLDIAWMKRPQGVIYSLVPRNRIYLLLKGAGANTGTYRQDWFVENCVPKLFEKEEAKKISDSTQIIGIGSVLIVTVAFAAAFTIPGGFRAEEPHSGTAVLAGKNVFRAFIIANTLALICSGLATMNVMFAGVPTVDIRTRMSALLLSIFFIYCSAKSLGAAFVFGLFVVLVPVAAKIAYISCAIATPILLLDVSWFIFVVAVGEVMLLKRSGCKTWGENFHISRIPNIITDMLNVLQMPPISNEKRPPSSPETNNQSPHSPAHK